MIFFTAFHCKGGLASNQIQYIFLKLPSSNLFMDLRTAFANHFYLNFTVV
jgi:hypothetical protein